LRQYDLECIKFNGEDLIIKTLTGKRIPPMIKILISREAETFYVTEFTLKTILNQEKN
jgi:hypothetical protein